MSARVGRARAALGRRCGSTCTHCAAVGAAMRDCRAETSRDRAALRCATPSRAVRRSPAHALFILVVLAVAIAAATVTFSVVDAVVLRPLPFDRSDQLVQICGPQSARPVSVAHGTVLADA